MLITLVYSPAERQVRQWQLELPAGSTVLQALESSGIYKVFPELRQLPSPMLGIWGKPADSSQMLQENGRIEFYRPLRVDPKVARRERFDRQGARSAGLFAAKRAGAKAGY